LALLQTNAHLLEGLGGSGFDPPNVYVRNWSSSAVELISVSTSGNRPNAGAYIGSLSATGRFVAFASPSTDLVAGPPTNGFNLFLRDRLLQTTELLTRPFAGGTPTEPMTLDVFPPALSADGRYVAFASSSRELLPVDPSVVPLAQQVYVLDRQLDRFERVSVTADGAFGNHYSGTVDLSDDGRWLAFYSQASNLPAGGPAIYVVDRWGGQWLEVTAALGPTLFGTVNLDLASDGSTIAFSWAASRPELPGFGRLNIYTVDLQGLPPAPARDVATLDRTATLLLLALLALTGLRRLAGGDGWPSGRRLATRG